MSYVFCIFSQPRSCRKVPQCVLIPLYSWQVTRVVKPDELGRLDESLREQMRKLELSPQATDSAAATTATKGTTPTVSTCCHSYSPTCSRNAIYSISSTENSSD